MFKTAGVLCNTCLYKVRGGSRDRGFSAPNSKSGTVAYYAASASFKKDDKGRFFFLTTQSGKRKKKSNCARLFQLFFPYEGHPNACFSFIHARPDGGDVSIVGGDIGVVAKESFLVGNEGRVRYFPFAKILPPVDGTSQINVRAQVVVVAAVVIDHV